MQPEFRAMGPEHSGHTRIWLLTNGLDGLYRVGLSWGLGTVEAMGVLGVRGCRSAETEDMPKIV
jgi:hypothetical protein